MTDKIETVAETARDNQRRALDTLDKLADAAKPEAVFSKAVLVGETQMIMASEVFVGFGFGFGMGSGPRFITNLPDEEDKIAEEETGMGSGGGGGGGAGARPVAVITIKEDEVTVKPVIDATKVALALFSLLGSAFFMGAQIRKSRKL